MTEAVPQPEQSFSRPPAPNECRLCGSVPAVNVSFSGAVGMVLIFRTLSNTGPFCRDCGLHVFREMTSNTLMVGWWSWISAVVNPFMVLGNLRRRRYVARLAAPQKDRYVVGPIPAPLDPGKPVMRRFQSWLGPGLVTLFLGLVVVVGITQNRLERVGGCVNGINFVSCEQPHDGKIIAVVDDKRKCPAEADGYLQKNNYRVFCLTSQE